MKSIPPPLQSPPARPPKPDPAGSALRSFAALVSAFFLVGGIIFAKPVSELTRSQAALNTRFVEPDIDAAIRSAIISCGPDRQLVLPPSLKSISPSTVSLTYSLDALEEAKDEAFQSEEQPSAVDGSLFSEQAGSVSVESEPQQQNPNEVEADTAVLPESSPMAAEASADPELGEPEGNHETHIDGADVAI